MLYPLRSEDVHQFEREVVKKVAHWDQSCNINICGSLGTGKSLAGNRICENMAKIKAEKYGGKPSDYWSIEDEHTCVMNLKELVATVKFMNEPENEGDIILMDDISPILNSRASNSKENKNNNILMTVGRTSKLIIVRTFPFNFMTEKYIRHLGNYLIEMQKTPNLFPYGYSTSKIFSIETNRDGSEPYNAFLQNFKHEKYVRAIWKKPSQNIIDIYTERRANAKKILDQQAIDVLTKITNPNEDKEYKTKKSDIYREIYEKFDQGEYGTMSLVQVCKELNVPYNQVKQQSFLIKHQGE